jgi:hypothetical protein
MTELFSSTGISEFIRRFVVMYNRNLIDTEPRMQEITLVSRVLSWVDPLSKYSYPNAVFGLVFG